MFINVSGLDLWLSPFHPSIHYSPKLFRVTLPWENRHGSNSMILLLDLLSYPLCTICSRGGHFGGVRDNQNSKKSFWLFTACMPPCFQGFDALKPSNNWNIYLNASRVRHRHLVHIVCLTIFTRVQAHWVHAIVQLLLFEITILSSSSSKW